MTPKYCLPIIAKSLTELKGIIAQYEGEYDYFEIWLDYLEDLSDTSLKELLALYHSRLLLVFRRQHLEPMRLAIKKRLHYASLAADSKTYVDLDISSQQQELAATSGKNQVIASYHNYSKTPGTNELQAIVQSMEIHKPAIYKLATACHSEADALRLLTLQQELKNQGKRVIILGMGEHGYATRIFGTLWGNEMIFAPPDTTMQSAPGQLTKSQLQAIFKELQHGRQ